MAVPPPPSPPQCIDLTGDDDNVISIAAPAPSRGPANGTYALPTVVNGHRHHGRPSHPITGDHNRSAKRVKLSKPDTEPLLRLSEPIQHYAGQCIDEGARDHPWVNRVDLDRKVAEGLLQKYGSIWPRDDGDISMGEIRDIVLTCEELVKQFVAASRATQNPRPAPRAPSQPSDPTARTNGGPFARASLPPTVINLTEDDRQAVPVATATTPRPPKREVSRAPTIIPTSASSLNPPLYLAPTKKRRLPSPATPKVVKKTRATVDAQATSPQNFRSRAKKAAWKSDVRHHAQQSLTSTYFVIASRPYLSVTDRISILQSNGRLAKLKPDLLQKPEVFHIDFRLDEVQEVRRAIRKIFSRPAKNDDPYKDLARLLHRLKPYNDDRVIKSVATRIAPQLEHRRTEDLYNFLADIYHKRPLTTKQSLSLARDPYDKRAEDLREFRLSSLLLAREVSGTGFGGPTRRLENFRNEFRKCLEDGLEIRSEFTNCAGDVSTIIWVSNQAYVAGTTVHMDAHNQQYNKPGNLVLGSIACGSATLRAYPDHRIVRPIVEQGENSTAAMRASQDPWLYTSVVSSDYDPIYDRTYTAGFDKKVKVWSIGKSGISMACIGTWGHDENVNFVQASAFRPFMSQYGFVATAADTHVEAVRIYRVIPNSAAESTFRSFSCSRIFNADNTPVNVDKWTYFPSALKWGIEDSVKHLLLVGYSPRSRTDDDRDIPADRLNTGELCLWDACTGEQVTITGPKTQNVFEVLWHPSQPVFIAATSPTIGKQDVHVKTQVRIFSRSEIGQFGEIKTLNCMASDINELTIMPNCEKFCYVTVGCTDGKTYVWDTAFSEKPIHILAHGPAVEGVRRYDDEDDTGIKFTAWGTSLDHFYTGSSDGVVKVWNVRTSGKSAKGRVILEAPAQISFGAFSPDKSKLVIGDASGRVFILSVDEEEGKPASFTNLAGPARRRIPNQITQHPEPPPPTPSIDVALPANDQRTMVDSGQLRYSGDPTVGMVQGPNYSQSSYFRREAHNDCDPTQPLQAHFQAIQQEQCKIYSSGPRQTWPLGAVPSDGSQDDVASQHSMNDRLDLKFEDLILETQHTLSLDGIGEQELVEGVQYAGLEEDEEAHLRGARSEVVRERSGREERFWV